MGETGSYKGVQRRFDTCNAEVRAHFQYVPSLMEKHPWEVLIAYVFMQLESGHNRAIHGSVVKLHRANVEVVQSVLDDHRMTRSDFTRLLKTTPNSRERPRSCAKAMG